MDLQVKRVVKPMAIKEGEGSTCACCCLSACCCGSNSGTE